MASHINLGNYLFLLFFIIMLVLNMPQLFSALCSVGTHISLGNLAFIRMLLNRALKQPIVISGLLAVHAC